jgi:hypothetical protein
METSLDQSAAECSHSMEGPSLDRAEGEIEPLGDLALGEAVLLA